MSETEKTLYKICQAAADKKANDIQILDLRGISSICDYYVIASADSTRRVKTIAEHIEEELDPEGIDVWHKEGVSDGQWILLDYNDIVVHIFYGPLREYYNLEGLWPQAGKRDFIETE